MPDPNLVEDIIPAEAVAAIARLKDIREQNRIRQRKYLDKDDGKNRKLKNERRRKNNKPEGEEGDEGPDQEEHEEDVSLYKDNFTLRYHQAKRGLQLMYEEKMGIKTEGSLTKYLGDLKRLFTVLGEDSDLNEELPNYENTIEKIIESDYSVNTRRSLLQLCVIICEYIPLTHVTEAVKEKYVDTMNELRIESSEQTAARKEKPLDITFDDIKAKVLADKKNFTKHPEQSLFYLLVSLYSELALRAEYQQMQIVKTVADGKRDKEQNCIVVPEDASKPCIIVLNKYNKVGHSKRYKPLEEKLSLGLSTLVRDWIHIKKLKYDDNLLPGKTPISKTISDALKKIGIQEKGSAINLFRQLSETEIRDNPHTNAQLVTQAKKMGHSVATAQAVYTRKRGRPKKQ